MSVLSPTKPISAQMWRSLRGLPTGVVGDDLAGASLLVLPSAAWFGIDWAGVGDRLGGPVATRELWDLPGYRGDDADDAAERALAACAQGDWNQHRGIDLRDACRGSAACMLNGLDGVDDPRLISPVVEQFVRGVEAVIDALRAHESVRGVVVCNGLHHWACAAVEGARLARDELSRDVSIVAVEGCCFPGWVYAETETGVSGNRSMLGPRVRDSVGGADTDRAAGIVTGHVRSRLGLVEGDKIDETAIASGVRARLGVRDGERLLVLFGQVRSDTTLAYDAPAVDRTVDLARAAIRELGGRPGWRLVIKPHPKERVGRDPVFHKGYADATFRELLACPVITAARRAGRAVLLEPCGERDEGDGSENTYALMAAADAGVCITSQAGLEYAAWLGRPVAVCGDAFYGRAGFTEDAMRVDDVSHAVRSAMDSAEADTDGCVRVRHERSLAYVDRMLSGGDGTLVETGDPDAIARRIVGR